MSDEAIRQVVKEKYRRAALRVTSGDAGCCGPAAARDGCDPVTSNLYAAGETAALPAEAVAASLGCGNPTALAELAPGEIVLDLGSGGGIDCFLAAKRIGQPVFVRCHLQGVLEGFAHLLRCWECRRATCDEGLLVGRNSYE